MKKIGMVFVAIVAAVGLAACGGGGGSDPDPVGTWTMTTDWQCVGTPTASVLHVYSDGTWLNTEENTSGGWTINGDAFMMVDSSGTIYSGTFEGTFDITGTVQGPLSDGGGRESGCWTAALFNSTP